MPNDIVTTQSINNVDITPVLKEVIEYSKDQASTGSIELIVLPWLTKINISIERTKIAINSMTSLGRFRRNDFTVRLYFPLSRSE